MKNLIYLTLIGITLFSCSSGDSSGGGDNTPTTVNSPPTTPTLLEPADNKLCLGNSSIALQWNGSTDPDKDVITYEIQVAKDNQFTQIVQSAKNINSLNYTVTLEKNTAYYWHIKAADAKGLSSNYSATYKFYTAGDAVIDHLPFSPELVEPALNNVLNATTVILKWNASDVDASDVLTYDVYFGATNPPLNKIGSDIAVKTATVNIEPAKEYFWKVVVKDNKGGETIGQIWNFKNQ